MKRLMLSKTDKKLTGLCGGIAAYVAVDSTVIRLIVLTIIIMSGVLPGTLLYVIASAITPKEGDHKRAKA
jgi:phage shock protein C